MNEDIKKRFDEIYDKNAYLYSGEEKEKIWQFISEEINKAKIDENKKWAKATKLDSVNSFNFNNRISELKEVEK